jgi:hypothetical protein
MLNVASKKIAAVKVEGIMAPFKRRKVRRNRAVQRAQKSQNQGIRAKLGQKQKDTTKK